MDRSSTDETITQPQGEAELFKMSLNTVEKIKPVMAPSEQINLLRESIRCAHSWCPITTWGVKKTSEHLARRFQNSLFAPKCTVTFGCGIGDGTRLIELVACSSIPGDKIYIDSRKDTPEGELIRNYFYLFLTEKAEIAVFKSESRIAGEEVLPAHVVEVFLATDELLTKIISYPYNVRMHKEMTMRAIESLTDLLHWAQDGAQKRVQRFGYGINTMRLITEKFKGTTPTT